MGFNPEGGGGLALAGLSTAISLVISSYCIYMHATNYSMPRIQRLIMRILFVCPVYALGSMLSLRFPGASMALETGRDIMEAFVIYSFLCLVLEYAGGDATCVNRIKNEPPLHHPFPLCYLKPIQRDGRFLRICKQGTLQFVIVKPVMAVIALIMISKHKYNTVAYQGFQVFVYNLSYSMALYCLVLFYLGTRVILAQFSPVRKFLAVKSIVFATYWQSLAVRLWVGPEEANAWNNFIICVEMVPFSVFLGVAFSHREYIRGIPDSSVLRSIKEMFSVRDVVQDAVHNFMPTYQDYVLQRPASPQSNGSGGPAPPKKYRARTFLAGNIDRWQLMDHDQLDHDDHMLEDDVSVDGIGTSINADGGMELGEAGPRTGYSPQRNGHSPQRNGPHRGLSSSASSPPRFSRGGAAGSPATPPEQLTKSGSIGGGSSASASARKQPSAASRPSPQVPLQGGGPRQRGGSAEGDLISLDSPMPQPITSPPMQGVGASNPFSTGSPGKKFTTINLETP